MKKEDCKEKACLIPNTNNCENPVICPICGAEMELLVCFIPREEMHMAMHSEPCSEWECICGYTAFQGTISKKFYPYKKIILK